MRNYQLSIQHLPSLKKQSLLNSFLCFLETNQEKNPYVAGYDTADIQLQKEISKTVREVTKDLTFHFATERNAMQHGGSFRDRLERYQSRWEQQETLVFKEKEVMFEHFLKTGELKNLHSPIKCKNVVWVWKEAVCNAATFGFYIISVLHEQQNKNLNFCYAERAFLMWYEHQKAITESLMLEHASYTLWVMQNLHDKL